MKKLVVASILTATLTAGAAIAASHGADPIATRKNGMQGVGLAMGTLAAMAKGEAPFNEKSALSALKLMNYVAATFEQHFPEGSNSGGDTTAAPKIWEDMAGFKAAVAKLQTDTAAAIEAAPASAEALGPIMGSVGGNCKSCHESFRVKK
ncbi:c-type cytochrome [Salaquimonas pukyongi]|uniref:c-type cytochrome n=1 Tax=Salaquimonas pukyongi TaxID=2712698 RepID=UPI00096BAF97|nr:cytochrome c [Salaquimonas pukyongi]